MFEKDGLNEFYNREFYTMEEKLFEKYCALRKVLSEIENYKYGVDDPFVNNKDLNKDLLPV